MKIHEWQKRKKRFSIVDGKLPSKESLKFIKNNDKILDIGCGDCSFFDYVIKHRHGLKLYAFDIIKDSLEIARKKGYKPVNNLSLKEKFNVITMFEVIEHLGMPMKLEYARIIDNLLDDNGYLIISFPNVKSVLAQQNYFNNLEHKTPVLNENNIKVLFSDYRIVHRRYINPWLNPLKILHSFFTGYGYKAVYNNVLFVMRKK